MATTEQPSTSNTTTNTSLPHSSKPKYLNPSPLGTKEYWSTLYANDLQTRQHTHPTHTGTTWFDDADAESKTIRYLAALTQAPDISPFLAEAATAGTRLSRGNTSFLDLGTGNGSFLFALRQEGWDGVMVGVDYASESLVLARGIWEGILQDEGDDGEGEGEEDERDEDGIVASRRHIEFRYLNVLTLAESGVGLPEWMPVGGYDVVLDKGTFDAVSLSGDCDLLTGRRIVELYAHAAKRLMKKPYGRMVVTSCNWTESELESWFCGGVAEDEKLKVIEKVPYRKFQFGGREGSVVVGLVFGWSLDE